MVWNYPGIELHAPYRDPEYAGRDKPIVDVASPISALKKSDWYSKGVTYGFIVQNSLCHFMQTPETVSYTDTYSTYDCCWWSWSCMNIMQFCVRGALSTAGCHNLHNPRTAWAHNILWLNCMIRTNLSFLCVAAYFYTYEFLYTYVPWFKINDPSPEGWKDVIHEGQTTYRARFAAATWILAAHVVYTRSMKRTGTWAFLLYVYMAIYESGRIWCWSSPTLLGFTLIQEREKHARLGSLVPASKHEIDPDTGKTYQAAQSKYQRFGNKGTWQDDMWNHQSHDYAPLQVRGVMVPNPYYNPRKLNDGRVYLDRDNTVQYNARPQVA